MSDYHNPVLLKESIAGLITNPSGIYADATFGGGGHSAEILRSLDGNGRLIAFDRDSDALENSLDDPRFTLIHNNFRFIHNYTILETGKARSEFRHPGRQNNGKSRGEDSVEGLDGILADLGVSSHQFDTAQRGFSFRFDGPLDMRMNDKASLSAEDVVNGYDKENLERILRLYGEIENAGRLAQLIVSARTGRRISTTGELNEAIRPALPPFAEHKELARIYQALRIEVNQEMRSLEKFLEGAAASLKKGGRLVVITYHSLEDRMVKNFIRCGNTEGEAKKDLYGNLLAPFRSVNKKPILPQESEIEGNTRSRSAKLRIGERI